MIADLQRYLLIMEPLRSITERLAAKAVSRLSRMPTEFGRSNYGVLYFKWQSPCPEIDALWVSVQPTEVTLSCRISHTHFSATRYHHESLTRLKLKRRIVHDGFREVSRFLDGEVAATISYDAQGKVHSYGWCDKSQLHSSMEYLRKVFGADMSERAWNWDGEVNVSS
ncbi:hypothetical protein [Polaromonas sp. YR568]|uniref:hypothetical protein n=1 Tax=Polaromonas sp. YR568 TaxID=1855301 RepID=UPI001113402C|nr:hypothetical protein [Polaromonas sp. YR568]